MTATPGIYNITIYRGDDWSETIVLATGDTTSSTPINLTGSTILSQIRTSETATGSPLATINIANRVDASGQFDIQLPNTITAALPIGSAVYDIQVTSPGGIVTTYLKGSVTVVADVSRTG